MLRSQQIIKVTFLAFLLFPAILQSQVVVEKSREKVIISGKTYYIHIVKKGETAYSISKAYDVTVQDLTKENPSAENGVKVDQVLRIPVVESRSKPDKKEQSTKVTRDESKYIYHKLNPGESVFALSKKFGVSEDEILQSNAGIEINKMPVGFEIAIPRRQFMNSDQKLQVQEKTIIEHKVLKGENLYSIAGQYGTTVKELRRENKGLMFPKVDEFIRIPVVKVAETVIPAKQKPDTAIIIPQEQIILSERPLSLTPVSNLKGTFNVALLLPLYFEENAKRIEIDSSHIVKGKPVPRTIIRPVEWIYPESLGFVELYAGILIAADTLRSLGLDINLHVYDIKSDTVEVSRLIESGVLNSMDLIIGPVYSQNLSIVASYASRYEIPIISPVPLINNAPLDNNPFLFKVNPSIEVAQDAIAKRVVNFWDYNFVFIHSDSANTNPDVALFKNKIFKELTVKIPFDDVRFKFKEHVFYSRSVLGEDSINRLEHAMSGQAGNLVIIASEDPPVISECVANLKTLSKKYDIRLMGYPVMRELDNEDWKDYFDLGIEIYTPYWIDYNMRDIKNFDAAYRKYFFTEPSESSFAWEGYDLMYYFLSGLAIHGKKFISDPNMHNPDLLITSFQFKRKNAGSGFENQKLYLIKYVNEMDVKLLEEPVAAGKESIR
jgi:LysM repeat protein/ABC-type branched-subunit amino acid transport system substrate-binding protein